MNNNKYRMCITFLINCDDALGDIPKPVSGRRLGDKKRKKEIINAA